MGQFRDAKGRAWDVTMSIGDVKRVRGLIPDVDLIDPQSGAKPLVQRLIADPCLLIDVVYALVHPQAKDAGVDDESFGCAMAGEAFKAASSTFWEAWDHFFMSIGRPELAEWVRVHREAVDHAVKSAEQKLKALDIADAVQKFQQAMQDDPEGTTKLLEQAEQRSRQATIGTTSTEQPESQALTQAA